MTETRIHPSAFVDDSVELEDGVEIGPLCVVGEHSRLGAGTRLLARSTVGAHTSLGPSNVLHPGSVIGGPPQDKSYRDEPTRLVVGAENVFREGVTVNRGTVKGGGETRIGDGNLLMACSHVGHDCILGSHVILANNVLLAGHIEVGDGVVLAGSAAFHHFLRIGRLAYVGGNSRVVHDVPPLTKVSGDPARPRAINEVGLRRAGIPDDQILALRALYRRLFHSGRALSAALADEVQPGSSLEAELIEALRERGAAPNGRHLEQFRRDRKSRKP